MSVQLSGVFSVWPSPLTSLVTSSICTERFWWFDEFLHFFTPLILTLALALRLYDNGLAEIREHKLILALTVACAGVTAATLWEIAEWAYDQLVVADVILGKTDTISDLILGTAGAIVAGAIIVSLTRTSSRGKLP